MQTPSKKEINNAFDKIRELYRYYSFLYEDADTDALKAKIQALAQEHLISKVGEIYYSVTIPVLNRKKELDEALKKAKKKEKKD